MDEDIEQFLRRVQVAAPPGVYTPPLQRQVTRLAGFPPPMSLIFLPCLVPFFCPNQICTTNVLFLPSPRTTSRMRTRPRPRRRPPSMVRRSACPLPLQFAGRACTSYSYLTFVPFCFLFRWTGGFSGLNVAGGYGGT